MDVPICFKLDEDKVGGLAEQPKQFYALHVLILKPLVKALTLLLRLTAESTIGVELFPFLSLFLVGEISSTSFSESKSSASFAEKSSASSN